eukprot:TRINITY_DN20096_c0_g1_i1.p1 TRINITY_DN20096_c0_g1~~TRINITY_DN20096_c0_g1_i1.p1  ORF type:complete len:484 (-),score=64.08 TRINITY_DN20096_c0_g1_i1:177-1628(-)
MTRTKDATSNSTNCNAFEIQSPLSGSQEKKDHLDAPAKNAAPTPTPLSDFNLPVLVPTCLAIGCATGIFVTAFNTSVKEMQARLGISRDRSQVQLCLLPAAGGLAVGLLQMLARMCGLSCSIPDLASLRKGALANDKLGVAHGANLVIHVIFAVLSLGFANSLGPMLIRVQIGSVISAILASQLSLRSAEREILLVTGVAAGVAAGAHAPLAAVVYGLEQVWPAAQMRLLYAAFCMLGAAAAMAASLQSLSVAPVLKAVSQEQVHIHKVELALCAVLGVLCGSMAWLFVNVLKPQATGFWLGVQGRGVNREWHPALAGAAAGVVVLSLAPEVLFMGWANFQQVLLQPSDFTIGYLLVLSILKLVLTALAQTSGLPGGLFAPSMFAGAALGGAVGSSVKVLATLMESKAWISTAATSLVTLRVYTTVGMASTLGTVCGAPGTAMVLVFELTRDYDLVSPCLWGIGGAVLAVAAFDHVKEKAKSS